MPTNEEFQEVYDSLLEYSEWVDDYCVSLAARARFPRSEDHEAFLSWQRKQNDDWLQIVPVYTNTKDIPAFIDSMDFYDTNACKKLMDWRMNTPFPWIPLGRENGVPLRIVADAHPLPVHRLTTTSQTRTSDVLPPRFVGINTSLHAEDYDLPLVESQMPSSPESHYGFVGYQLGVLEYVPPDTGVPLGTTQEEMERVRWANTGYVVVARINPRSGRVNSYYAVRNEFPELTGHAWNIEKVPTHLTMLRCKPRIARIGDRLQDMGCDDPLEWRRMQWGLVGITRAVLDRATAQYRRVPSQLKRMEMVGW